MTRRKKKEEQCNGNLVRLHNITVAPPPPHRHPLLHARFVFVCPHQLENFFFLNSSCQQQSFLPCPSFTKLTKFLSFLDHFSLKLPTQKKNSMDPWESFHSKNVLFLFLYWNNYKNGTLMKLFFILLKWICWRILSFCFTILLQFFSRTRWRKNVIFFWVSLF